MADLTREDIFKLAQLAHVQLEADEVDTFAQEFSAILHYVEQLNDIDTSGLQPTSQVTGLENVMRDDAIIDYGYSPHKLLENAPHTQDDQLKVKRMIG